MPKGITVYCDDHHGIRLLLHPFCLGIDFHSEFSFCTYSIILSHSNRHLQFVGYFHICIISELKFV